MHLVRRVVAILAAAVVLTLGLVAGAWAAEAAPAFDLKTLVTALIPLAVPLVIAVGKAFIPRLPRRALPFVAAGLGAGIELAGYFSGASSGNLLLGALLGSAGVGLREMYDQAKQVLAGA